MYALLFWNECEALVGYDCVNQPLNITPISISSVVPCPETEPPMSDERVVIQLVQDRLVETINYVSCLVERSIIITYCGMHSHAAMLRKGFSVDDVVHVSREACYAMVNFGTFRSLAGELIADIGVNNTKRVALIEVGNILTDDGECKGGSISFNGEHYRDVLVQSFYKIHPSTGRAKVDLEEGTFKTPGGQSYAVNAEAGFDSDLGHMYWKQHDLTQACSKTSYTVLYEGPAIIYTSPAGSKTLIINDTNHILAVGLKTPILVCHLAGISTDHGRLFVLESTKVGFYFQKTAMNPLDADMFLYINSKLVYLEKHLSRELKSVYKLFTQRVCEVQHQVLNQLITLAYTSPNEFAWTYTKRAGVTAIIRGEVVYLITCRPVSVDFRSTTKCYQEIPVTHNGTAQFLKPRSRIIVTYGSEIDCSPLAPAIFNLGGKWMRMQPEPSIVTAPSELSAVADNEWVYSEADHLMTAGIYSTETLKEFQKKLMFPVEKPAIIHTIGATMAGYEVSTQQLDALHLLKSASLEKLQMNFMEKIYGWWFNISLHVGALTGFVVILFVIKNICDMVINGKFLYDAFGFSFRLLAAVWGTLAKHMLIKTHLNADTENMT
jgi:hypothetical protein